MSYKFQIAGSLIAILPPYSRSVVIGAVRPEFPVFDPAPPLPRTQQR